MLQARIEILVSHSFLKGMSLSQENKTKIVFSQIIQLSTRTADIGKISITLT